MMRSLILLLSCLAMPWTAVAQDHCPNGNLLAKKKAKQVGVKYAFRLTNHASGAEGGKWNGPQSAIFNNKTSSATYDLGRITGLSALYVQADNNDTYVVSVSDDGQTFDEVWTVPIHPQGGLRTRSIVNLAGQARYIRLSPGQKGDSSFSVTEFQAYCSLPDVWPPAVTTPKSKSQSKPLDREQKLSIAKITLLTFGFLVFVLLLVHRRWPEYTTLRYLIIGGTVLIGYGVVYAVGWAPTTPPKDATPKWAKNALIVANIPLMLMVLFGVLQNHILHRLLNRVGVPIETIKTRLGAWKEQVLTSILRVRSRFDEVRSKAQLVGIALLTCVVAYLVHDQVAYNGTEDGLIQWTPTLFAWCGFIMTMLWASWALARALSNRRSTVLFEYGPLLTIIFASGVAFSQFGMFHGSSSGAKALHDWDAFHYYIGGKYYRENGYGLIYQCANAADVEDGLKHTFDRCKSRDKIRLTRDLKNNKLQPAERAITDEKIKECHEAFGVAEDPARWLAFKQDMRLFRKKMGQHRWQRMFKDHGSNATPAWNIVGHPLTNIGWASIAPPEGMENSPANIARLRAEERKALSTAKTPAERKKIREQYAEKRTAIQDLYTEDKQDFIQRMSWYALIDPVLYALGFLLIWWAFGIYGCAFTILMWCGGYPWVYSWTGGGFGRVPWWFMMVAGTCFLRRGWSFFGGASITWAMLLRVFPGAIIAGVSLKIAHQVLAHKRLLKTHYRLIMGCTVSLVTLVGLSMAVGGANVYGEFLDNSFKHKETRLTNEMGLGTVASFSKNGLSPTQWKNASPDIAWKTKCPKCMEVMLKDQTSCAEDETPTRIVLKTSHEELVGCLKTELFDALTGVSSDEPKDTYEITLIDPENGWKPIQEGESKRSVAFDDMLRVSHALVFVGEMRSQNFCDDELKIALLDDAIYPPVDAEKAVWTQPKDPKTGKRKTITILQSETEYLNVDPFMKWKAYRWRNIADQSWGMTGTLIVFLIMLWYAGRRLSDWEVTALAAIILVGIFDLTCYYYSIVVLLALISLRRFTYMFVTFLMVIAGQALHHQSGVSFEVDYVWESRIFVAAQFLILLGVCIEVFLADRGRSLGEPLTAGLRAVNPVCWEGAPEAEHTHEPTDEARFSFGRQTDNEHEAPPQAGETDE